MTSAEHGTVSRMVQNVLDRRRARKDALDELAKISKPTQDAVDRIRESRRSRNPLFYLTGIDNVLKHLDHQERLLSEKTGTKGPHLPFDGGLKTAGIVYADRLRLFVEQPFVIFSRLTGIDAVTKAVKRKKNKYK